MEAVEEALKYMKLYTGCEELALRRMRPILEKLYTEREKTIVVKEKEIVEVFVQKARPKGTIQVWAEKYFADNKTTYDLVNRKSRKTEACRLRNLFCTAAYKAGYAYSEIGRYLNRDHTTIMHNVNKIKTI